MRFLQLKAIFKILTVFLRISRMFIKQASNSVRMRLLKWQPGLRSGLIKRFLEICIWETRDIDEYVRFTQKRGSVA